MSQRASPASPAEQAEHQVYRKPRVDVYTVLLSIALIAVGIAATALWLIMAQYKYEINKGTWNRPAAPAAFDPPRVA
jgi:hypothetical protein